MIVLGSTGSIGKNALFLAKKHGLKITALACASNFELLNKQILELSPKLVYIADPALANKVNHKSVFSGDICEFLVACAGICEAKNTTLINALVGFAGLRPSKKAQELGFNLALANKESLVAGGAFLDTDKITPIDSEHFGLKFLLDNTIATPSRLIITASGGACLNLSKEQITNLSPEVALKHPNWSMGAKITIDSATMANKLFEVLEAFWLYKISQIDALIEATSTVHALVEFSDGSTTAHISKADMKLAIAYALGLKERVISPFDLLAFSAKFMEIDLEKYPIFSLKNELVKNPKIAVIVNAANDVMVAKFLRGEVAFNEISKNILSTFERFCALKISSFDDVLEIDKKIRQELK